MARTARSQRDRGARDSSGDRSNCDREIRSRRLGRGATDPSAGAQLSCHQPYYHQPRLVEIPHTPQVTADVIFIPVLSHQEVRAIDRAWRARRKAHPASERTWPRVLHQELDYAERIAPDIRIVKVVKDREEADAFCASWAAY